VVVVNQEVLRLVDIGQRKLERNGAVSRRRESCRLISMASV
jgi:hypothetical protein